jgi:hypothetical protein
VRAFGQVASAVRDALGLTVLLLGVAGVVLVRAGGNLPGGIPGPDALRTAAADSLEAALASGGSGISFEVAQTSTMYAKEGGPRIEFRDPANPDKVTGVADEYQVGIVLSRGGVTAEAFWVDMSIALDGTADFSSAAPFARVLERDGLLWRDDGVGWYLTDESPGVGMDPVTARLLPGLLDSLADVVAIEPMLLDGRMAPGIRGTSGRVAFPGVIAADGAAFTEEAFGLEAWFDEEGRLVRLEAKARNLNQDTYDLICTTVVTFTYGAPGDPPDPTPTMAPEVLPTSEPGSVEVPS